MASVRPSMALPRSRISVHFPPDDSLATSLAYTSTHFLEDLDPETHAMARDINSWLSDDGTQTPSEIPSSPSIRSLEKVMVRRGRPLSANIVPSSVCYEDIGPRAMPRTHSMEKLNSTMSNTSPNQDDEMCREDGVEYPTGMKLGLIVTALCFAVFLMALDNSIIATAIPSITEEFNSLDDVGWYGSAYMLTTSALQLLFGKFYTFWSIKWVFLSVVTIFELGSLICGVAPNSMTLIIGRAVAGMGSAGIFAGALTIMAYTVPLRKRPLYTGLVGSMWGISAVAGPLLGGVFTDKATWRWCFYINLPIGALTIGVITLFFRDPKRNIEPKPWRERLWQLDPIGTVAFMPAIICILLALHWGGTTYPWDSARITSLLLVGTFLLLVFFYVQWRMQDNATVPPRIFKKRSVWSSAFFEFFLGACFLVGVYFLPIWFQAVKGTSPIQSGIRNIPMLLGVVIFSVGSGALVTYWGYYTPFIVIAGVLMPVGYGLLSTLTKDSGAAEWIGYQFLIGLALGIGMQQPLIAVQVVLDMADIPTGTAIIIFHQALGGALFVSAGQTVFTTRLTYFVKEYVPELDTETVLATGATKIRELIPAASIDGVIRAYDAALSNCFYLATAAAAAAILGGIFVEWKSVKGKNIEMGGGA